MPSLVIANRRCSTLGNAAQGEREGCVQADQSFFRLLPAAHAPVNKPSARQASTAGFESFTPEDLRRLPTSLVALLKYSPLLGNNTQSLDPEWRDIDADGVRLERNLPILLFD